MKSEISSLGGNHYKRILSNIRGVIKNNLDISKTSCSLIAATFNHDWSLVMKKPQIRTGFRENLEFHIIL